MASPAAAVDSIALNDKIIKGSASVDLLNNITAVDLEQYRQDTGGSSLLFAVDINENASGFEKATSLGGSLKSVWLVLTMGDAKQQIFSDFSTEIQVVLIEDTGEPAELPATFFTLLGDSGSNRITSGSGNIVLENFDSVLTVEGIDTSLAGVTVAVLEIELLFTDPALGDPEAFYDFNNGFKTWPS